MPQTCPLCHSTEITAYHQDIKRNYLYCANCDLVFVPAEFWPSMEVEKADYDKHENSPEDQGYRNFLSQLAEPLLDELASPELASPELPDNQTGLDFGCGSGPTFSVIMQEAGYKMELYDPFYRNYPELLNRQYNFITSTEVAEHLQKPKVVFAKLFEMLKPGGWLGIMTKLVQSQEAFRTWQYIRDKTHICFYSQKTMRYIAKRFKAEVKFVGTGVILFRKLEN